MDKASGMEAVIRRWEESGLSLMRFGAQEGIAYSKLLYWRKKLRGPKGGRRKASSPSRPAVGELVPVEVVEDVPAATPSSAGFSVWLGNGVGIDIPAGFDQGDFERLVIFLASC